MATGPRDGCESQDLQAAQMVVRRNGLALRDVKANIRNNREVVVAAVRENGLALEFASHELRGDRQIVLEAVKENGQAWRYASPGLQQSKSFAMEIVSLNGSAIASASPELRADKEFVLEAVTQEGCALQHASDDLKADRAVVLAAVRQNGSALKYAEKGLQTDQDLLLLAVRCGSAWEDWPPGQDVFASLYAEKSCLAVQGEDAPVLTIKLFHELEEGQQGQIEGAAFRCEAILMSGASFECRLPYGNSSGGWRMQRPSPTLNDLATKLVQEFRKRFGTKFLPARVFVNIVNADGEPKTATPWEWNRRLADFLVPTTTNGSGSGSYSPKGSESGSPRASQRATSRDSSDDAQSDDFDD